MKKYYIPCVIIRSGEILSPPFPVTLANPNIGIVGVMPAYTNKKKMLKEHPGKGYIALVAEPKEVKR